MIPLFNSQPVEQRWLLSIQLSRLTESQREWYEERAGILEFDGGFTREVAEIEALIQTRKFFNIKE